MFDRFVGPQLDFKGQIGFETTTNWFNQPTGPIWPKSRAGTWREILAKVRQVYTMQETQTAMIPNYWLSFGKGSPTAWFDIASLLLGKCNKKCSTRLPRPPASHRGGPRPRSTLVVPGCAGACTTRRSWKDKRGCSAEWTRLRSIRVRIYLRYLIIGFCSFKSHQPEFPVHFLEKMSWLSAVMFIGGSSNDICRSFCYGQCWVHSGYVHIQIVIEPTSWRDQFLHQLCQCLISETVCQDSSELQSNPCHQTFSILPISQTICSE